MTADNKTFNALDGAVFVQPTGPGTVLHFLGCHQVDDVEAPQGEIEVDMVRTPDGRWEVVGSRKAAPELVSTTITGLTKKARDWLEKVRCTNGALYVLQSTCAKKDNPMNYDRAHILHHINISTKTYASLATNNSGDTPEQSTHAMEIQAWPPLISVVATTPGRKTVTEVLALNDLWTDPMGKCQDDCGNSVNPGDVVGVACDSAVGPATGDILFCTDGATFTAGATDPFGAGLHTMAITAFPINKSGRRWLAGKEALAGAQGQVAYSDDAGATWTTVSVGGAAAGHGATYGGGLFSLSKEFIVLAGRVGYIYKSVDGGVTWTAKESGVLTAGDYKAVHFSDEQYGCAVAAAGVVSLTKNGGESWYAGGVIGSAAHGNLCVRVFDDQRIMVGDDGGHLWQSVDFGATWSEITAWTGSGAGAVRGLDFAPEGEGYVGFMIRNSAAPLGSVLRTIDGGANWSVIDGMPTNSGVNAVRAIDNNSAWIVGEANGGTGFVCKLVEA